MLLVYTPGGGWGDGQLWSQAPEAKKNRNPFTAKEIAKGALWDHLTQEDYDTPPEGKYHFTVSHLQLANTPNQTILLLTHN